MAKSKKELLAIRDESYRVVHAEVCRTCRHWGRHPWNDFGSCRAISVRCDVIVKNTEQFGTCDLWEGQKTDQ